MSVNDYPAAKEYYLISIKTHSREYRYFVYQDASQVYIELPYEDICKTDRQFGDHAAEYYTKLPLADVQR